MSYRIGCGLLQDIGYFYLTSSHPLSVQLSSRQPIWLLIPLNTLNFNYSVIWKALIFPLLDSVLFELDSSRELEKEAASSQVDWNFFFSWKTNLAQ